VYKLLIVEDEIWEREGLVSFLNWRELGIEIIGTAANGIQGFRKVEELLPDIIITDIKMPLMDGLELSKRVRSYLPSCQIIIISGYDNFEYAQDAIQFAVSEYLLKPVQKKPLIEALNRIINEISRNDIETKHEMDLKKETLKLLDSGREKFILDIIKGRDFETKETYDFFEKQLFSEHKFAVIVLKFDFFSDTFSNNIRDMERMFGEIFNEICIIMNSDGYVLKDNDTNYQIIVCISQNDLNKSNIEEFIERVKKIHNKIVGFKMAIGIGSIVESTQSILQSIDEAKIALGILFFSENSEVVFYENLEKRESTCKRKTSNFLEESDLQSKKLLNSALRLNPKDIAIISNEFFTYIKRSEMEARIVRDYFTCLMSEWSVFTFAVDQISSFRLALNNENLIESFIRLSDLKMWLDQLLIEINIGVTSIRKKREEKFIHYLMDRIRIDYHSDIGLETIANSIGISPTYLSNIFRSEFGKGFLEILTSYRLQKAQALLLDKHNSITEIARLVGFTSTSYFCTVFKKKYSMTPVEFREKMQDKDDDND